MKTPGLNNNPASVRCVRTAVNPWVKNNTPVSVRCVRTAVNPWVKQRAHQCAMALSFNLEPFSPSLLSLTAAFLR